MCLLGIPPKLSLEEVCFKVRRMLTHSHSYSASVESRGPGPNLLGPLQNLAEQSGVTKVKQLGFITLCHHLPNDYCLIQHLYQTHYVSCIIHSNATGDLIMFIVITLGSCLTEQKSFNKPGCLIWHLGLSPV